MAEATTRRVGKKADEAPTWIGPFTEHDRYNEKTGARYVRCRDCGAEVLARHRETATHRPGCAAGEAGK